MNSPAPWINEAIFTWQKEGIALNPGALEAYMAETEQLLGFSFPPDFYELYKVVNGFADRGSNKEMFSLWPLETIWEENPVNREEGFIAICDYMISSYHFGFLKDQPGIYRNAIGLEKVADSFKQFIELLNADSELLY
jgi:hypothetical protein